jgi:hypothetical protein
LEKIHHHDILTEALTRFAHDYGARDHENIVNELRRRRDDDGPSPTRRIADQVHTVQQNPARPERETNVASDGDKRPSASKSNRPDSK